MPSSRLLSTPVPQATLVTTSTPATLRTSPPCSPPPACALSSSTANTCHHSLPDPSTDFQPRTSSPILVTYSSSPLTTPVDVQAKQPSSCAPTPTPSPHVLHPTSPPPPPPLPPSSADDSDGSSASRSKKKQVRHTNSPVSKVSPVRRRSPRGLKLNPSQCSAEDSPCPPDSSPWNCFPARYY